LFDACGAAAQCKSAIDPHLRVIASSAACLTVREMSTKVSSHQDEHIESFLAELFEPSEPGQRRQPLPQRPAADEPRIVHTGYLDNPAAEAIARRDVATREAAGLLSGHAAG
jgi:hypothetical protein